MDIYLRRFKESLRFKTNEELVTIVINKEQYQSEAVDLAMQELNERQIDINNYELSSLKAENENVVKSNKKFYNNIFTLEPRSSNYGSGLFIGLGLFTFIIGSIYDILDNIEPTYSIISGTIFIILGLFIRTGYKFVVYIGLILWLLDTTFSFIISNEYKYSLSQIRIILILKIYISWEIFKSTGLYRKISGANDQEVEKVVNSD